MAESDSRTQIVIACISLVGVLAAAGATSWSDLATRQRFKTFELPDYCYAFD